MKSIFFASCTLLVFASCAKQYVAPSGVPTATITLSASLEQHYGSWVLVQNFDNESCASSPNGNRLASFSTKSIQGEGDFKGGVAKSIPANRPLVFSFIYQEGAAGFTNYTSCVVTQSFVPKPGAMYSAAFEIVADKCLVTVSREDGTDPKAVDSLHIVEPSCNNKLNG